MEDDLGPVLLEHLPQCVRVPDVDQDRVGLLEQAVPEDRQLDGVEPGLVTVEHDHGSRAELVHLSCELGTDGTSGSRDEHPLAGEVAGDVREVGGHLVSTEDVVDLDAADVAGLDATTHELGDPRQHQDVQPRAVRALLQASDELSSRARDGQDDRVHLLRARDVLQLRPGAQDRYAEDAEVALPGVVVHEPDDPQPQLALVPEQLQDLPACLAGAVDQRVAHVRPHHQVVRPLAEGTVEPASGSAEQECNGRRQHRDAARHGLVGEEPDPDPEDSHQADVDRQTQRLVERADEETAAVELRRIPEHEHRSADEEPVADHRLPLHLVDAEVVTDADHEGGGERPSKDVPGRECGAPHDRVVHLISPLTTS